MSLPTGPKIAVVPFSEVSGNADDTYFSDGLTKDINAYLSKFTNLFVLAPSSVSGFRANADCETIRSELGADYILEGSVRRAGEKLRVTTDQPAESCICFTAVLDNVAYHGSESHMFFTTDSGATLTATVQNETRTRAPFAAGERLWVSWIPGDTLVLGE